ncbi:TatD family hydrolase [Aporhodopirellula aestuarii]|uniref:TatD family hydrolase n=1 Tax=Aporhodopirellula aestuarii TaxID=2950107 RepID=A0ABT0TXN7_9BACT|nr:TatD family hydrolase [Aporhodopirellula aestuarii]MCM2369351.1 TatD family hydrolase [Aporhodopirellula aestuarii]
MLNLFDTHAHLNSDTFHEIVEETVARAKEVGVNGIAVIGIDVATSRRACELAAKYPGYLHAVVGIQPNSAAEAAEGDFAIIEELASLPGVVGIGETGLDCYWDDTPIEMQHDFFQRQLDFAVKASLPVVIHMRESCSLIIEQLRSQSQLPPAVMHSYTGSLDEAKACLDLGLMISFAGMVTFKKSDELREVAAMVPEDRILVETDSPYLSPEPLRGRRPNEPARVEHTLRCLAKVRGVTAEALAETTTANARRFFGL